MSSLIGFRAGPDWLPKGASDIKLKEHLNVLVLVNIVILSKKEMGAIGPPDWPIWPVGA